MASRGDNLNHRPGGCFRKQSARQARGAREAGAELRDDGERGQQSSASSIGGGAMAVDKGAVASQKAGRSRKKMSLRNRHWQVYTGCTRETGGPKGGGPSGPGFRDERASR
ncbi:unnamed protein product [Calypogeia fissa]